MTESFQITIFESENVVFVKNLLIYYLFYFYQIWRILSNILFSNYINYLIIISGLESEIFARSL